MPDDFLEITIPDLEVTPDLKLKKQVSQVPERAVSELIFATGSVDVDTDLTRMFKHLEQAKQTMFEAKGGQQEVKNLFVAILDKTKNLKDHKVLPDRAVQIMFEVGTTVQMDHTLKKDAKMSQEQMKIKAATRVLDQTLSGGVDAMLAELSATVKTNNNGKIYDDMLAPPAKKQAEPDPFGDFLNDL